MITLYHIPFHCVMGQFGHQSVMGMQFYPTIVSYWLKKSDGRRILLRRVQKPLMLRDGGDGCSVLKMHNDWIMLTTQCNMERVICYRCIDNAFHTSYYSIGNSILSIMLGRRFFSAKSRIYPSCLSSRKGSKIPQLVPQLTWWS